jgi:hypothetical protein
MNRLPRPFASLAFLVSLAACTSGGHDTARIAEYSFDSDAVGGPPARMTLYDTGEGGPARWQVVADDTAPSGGRVLEQSDGSGEDPRYCVALADALVARDVRVSVRLMPLTGSLDRSGGIVFRASGPDDYYVVRANLLEKDVGLYRTTGGDRVLLASWDQRLARNRWHELEVEAVGPRITVRWNGEKILAVRDADHGDDAVRCGLWTKADAVTRFDDLRIESLDAD